MKVIVNGTLQIDQQIVLSRRHNPQVPVNTFALLKDAGNSVLECSKVKFHKSGSVEESSNAVFISENTGKAGQELDVEFLDRVEEAAHVFVHIGHSPTLSFEVLPNLRLSVQSLSILLCGNVYINGKPHLLKHFENPVFVSLFDSDNRSYYRISKSTKVSLMDRSLKFNIPRYFGSQEWKSDWTDRATSSIVGQERLLVDIISRIVFKSRTSPLFSEIDLPHNNRYLFSGISGIGKTCLAHELARTSGLPFLSMNGGSMRDCTNII